MNESGDKCSCCCSQCPPWWVTMGFVPPRQLGQMTTATPAAPTPGTPTVPTPTQPQPQPSSNPLGGLGSVLGGVLSLL